MDTPILRKVTVYANTMPVCSYHSKKIPLINDIVCGFKAVRVDFDSKTVTVTATLL